jgi:uncharacterized protein (TIGR03790 family)
VAVSLARAQGLSAARLGVLYRLDDIQSHEIAAYYAARRGVPIENIVGVPLLGTPVIAPEAFRAMRQQALDRLPGNVQSLLLVWTEPFAVGCMSITTAFAAGYQPGFCEPGCMKTTPNPLFDSASWLPADTVGWWPSMLMPSAREALARAVIDRGVTADASRPQGIVYLVRTLDTARNVRADSYPRVEQLPGLSASILDAPIERELPSAIGYFIGAKEVDNIRRVHFLPGALADHLTSAGGVLVGGHQMPALSWLEQGASASYGTVSEPCNLLGKFPDIVVLYAHYQRGETALESYWKSVRMPGQGLFIGDPLARPFAAPRR